MGIFKILQSSPCYTKNIFELLIKCQLKKRKRYAIIKSQSKEVQSNEKLKILTFIYKVSFIC